MISGLSSPDNPSPAGGGQLSHEEQFANQFGGKKVPGIFVAKEPTHEEKQTAGYFVGENTKSIDQVANYYTGEAELRDKAEKKPLVYDELPAVDLTVKPSETVSAENAQNEINTANDDEDDVKSTYRTFKREDFDASGKRFSQSSEGYWTNGAPSESVSPQGPVVAGAENPATKPPAAPEVVAAENAQEAINTASNTGEPAEEKVVGRTGVPVESDLLNRPGFATTREWVNPHTPPATPGVTFATEEILVPKGSAPAQETKAPDINEILKKINNGALLTPEENKIMAARLADAFDSGKTSTLTPEELQFLTNEGKMVEDLLQERKKQQTEAAKVKDNKGKWEIPEHLKVPELPLGQTKTPFVVSPETPNTPTESFEDLQKQLEEKLKDVPTEDINKITRKFYLDHLEGYKVELGGIASSRNVIRNEKGQVVKTIAPFVDTDDTKREKQTNEFLKEELRKRLEANSGSAAKQEEPASEIDAEAEAQNPTATTEEIETSIAAEDAKEKLENEAKVDKEAKKKAKAERKAAEKKTRDEKKAEAKKSAEEKKTAKAEKKAANKKAKEEKRVEAKKVADEKRAARREKRAERLENLKERVRDAKDRIGERLNSIRDAIKEKLKNHEEISTERLKHFQDEADRLDYEFRDAALRIAREQGGKAADATGKLARKIGSGTMKALKIGEEKFYEFGDKAAEFNYRIGDAAWNKAAKLGGKAVDAFKTGADIATEGAEIVTTGALGGPAAATDVLTRSAEKVYETVQRGRERAHLNKADKIEDEIAQTYGHRPITDDIEATGSRYESGYKEVRELELMREADKARAKAEKIHQAMVAHKEQAKKLNIFNRAINALFRKEAPSIEYKNLFNT